MKVRDEISHFLSQALKDPYLSLDMKSYSGQLTYAAMILGATLCINGLITYSMVVLFASKCFSWMSFKALSTFGYLGAQVLLVFIRFKLMYLLLLATTQAIFQSQQLDIHHPTFISWRGMLAGVTLIGCLMKSPLLGVAIQIHLPTLFAVVCLLNLLAMFRVSQLVGTQGKIVVIERKITQGLSSDTRRLDNSLFANFHCQEVDNQIKSTLCNEKTSPIMTESSEQQLLSLVLAALRKNASIEVIKKLCTDPQTNQLYKSSSDLLPMVKDTLVATDWRIEDSQLLTTKSGISFDEKKLNWDISYRPKERVKLQYQGWYGRHTSATRSHSYFYNAI